MQIRTQDKYIIPCHVVQPQRGVGSHSSPLTFTSSDSIISKAQAFNVSLHVARRFREVVSLSEFSGPGVERSDQTQTASNHPKMGGSDPTRPDLCSLRTLDLNADGNRTLCVFPTSRTQCTHITPLAELMLASARLFNPLERLKAQVFFTAINYTFIPLRGKGQGYFYTFTERVMSLLRLYI